ncbi:MAG TPA: glycosyltransferase family 39 protein [Candidatus Acidoferrales bacterium]|nr:glycosyltransferase family 39 protein [Candidatus Acidoferrales bacterium]
MFAASTVVWLALDRLPPNWDDAWYLTNSLTVYDAFAHGGVAGYLAKLNSVFGFKAPLIAGLPTPFYLLFGRRWHAAYLVNIASMLVLFAALYRIATSWWNSRAAVFAIAITGAMPLLYALPRWYLVEYVLTALVTAAVCVLIESDGLKRDAYTVLFGALCGFGLLLKISFPVFILPPFVVTWIRSGCRARPLLLTALLCLLLALPWYSGHLRPTLANAIDAGFGAPAAIQGTGPILSLRTIVTYLSHVAADGVSYYFILLALLLSGWALFRGLLRRQGRLLLSSVTTKAWPLLGAWMLPFAVFVFGGNKDVRYIAPILPAAALVLAFLLDFTLPRTRMGAVAGGLLLAFPMLQMFSVSFGIPYAAAERGYARRFDRRPWPHDEILKLIAANSSFRPGENDGEKKLLLVGVDRGAFNSNNIELTVVALQLPFHVETTAHEKDLATLRLRLGQASFFLYKEGGEPESPAFNPYAEDLARSVAADRRFHRIPYDRLLPDGGMARIYENLAPSQNLAPSRNQGPGPAVEGLFTKSGSRLHATQGPDEFAIDFGGIVALTGISAVTTPDGAAVKFHWRCIKPPDRDYWCFTHLIDATNRIVAQFDHQLLGGQPPLSSWRAGDDGEEEIHLRLPSGTPPTGLRLRFGFYYPPSGERLQVEPLQGQAASRFSLTDHATALLTHI